MLSIWETDSFFQTTDILIIGAGLTGVNTAIELKLRAPKLSIRIIERGLFPSGASVKNAGFACFGSLSEVLDDINNIGEQKALDRVEKRYLGIQKLLNLVSSYDIDYNQDHGFEIFTDKDANLLKHCKNSLDSINNKLNSKLGFKPYSFESNAFGFNTSFPLLKIQGEGALHSGKLISQLIQKAQSLGVVFNFGFYLREIHPESSFWRVSDGINEFRTVKLIYATNGFTNKLLPNENIVPARGQLLLTEPIPNLNFKGTFHALEGYFYFRAVGNQILLGGGRNLDRENENTDSQDVSKLIQDSLEELLQKVILPDKRIKIAKRWAGTMAFGTKNEKDPIIKELETNVYIGARLGGMGVAMAPKLAEDLADLVLK